MTEPSQAATMLNVYKKIEIANVKWTASQISTFLHLLKKYQCLWRITDKNRKNKHLRDVALDSLLAEVQAQVGPTDLDMTTMKSKMKNLKTVYSRELAKVLKSEKLGENYVPGLRWYGVADSFLRYCNEAKEITLSTVDFQELLRNELNPESMSDIDCEVVESIDAPLSLGKDALNASFDDGSSAASVSGENTSSAFCRLPQSSSSNISSTMDFTSHNPGKRKLECSSTQGGKTLRSSCDAEDQFFAFGLYVAAELRQLNDDTQLKLAKHYINSILFDASMSSLLPP